MPADEIYFAYSLHRTRERAADKLESYYAEGIICEGERPYIDRVIDHHGRLRHYAVMFPGA